MRLVQWFSLPAAILAYCCTGALGESGSYLPVSYAAPEPAAAASGRAVDDECYPARTGGSTCDGGCSSLNACSGCGSGSGCLFPCRCTGDPWTLQSYLNDESSCYRYGGWVSAGGYVNAHGADNNGPIGFREVGDEFTVDQVWGFFERTTNTGGYGWDWGFRTDFVFGVDGPDTQAFFSHPDAYDNSWDASGYYGSALPQLYAELAVNNLSVKMGHFFTILGYERVPVIDNFFYSHSYCHAFGEPYTHTGVLAEYSWNDMTFWGGWTQGWNTGFDNYLGMNTFLGGIRAPLTDAITLTWALNAGDFGVRDGDIYMQSVIADVMLTKKLTYVFQTDWGGNSGGAVVDQWYGINNYLLYTINPCWAAGLRFEWYHDDDGTHQLEAGDYYGLTCGVNWKPRPNVRFRPELRYDWYDGAGALPFDVGQEDEQLSGGFDLIVTF